VSSEAAAASFAKISFTQSHTVNLRNEVPVETTGVSTPEVSNAIREQSAKAHPIEDKGPAQLPAAKPTHDTILVAVSAGADIRTMSPNFASAPPLQAMMMHSASPAATGATGSNAPHSLRIEPIASAGPSSIAIGGQDGKIAPPAAVASIRPTVESLSAPARTAALKVDLADGVSARASVSERAGGVQVRIVTNNSPVAQHLVAQVGGLRRAFDATGLRLNSADVSYRGEGGDRREGDGGEQRPRHDDAQSQNIFDVYEAEQ
jgi:hypothetical protein